MNNGKTIGIWSIKQKTTSCDLIVSVFDDYDISKEELESGVKELEKYVGREIKVLLSS
jgi:hypothetical protein